MFMMPPNYRSMMQTHQDLMKSWTHMFAMLAEAQTVITLRMLGMAGFWSVPGSENQRMFAEKLPAMTEAMFAAGMAGWRGQSPALVAQATLRPIRKRTRQNSRRLTRRGPRIPRY